ncbi:MAG: hypothetical protein ACTSRC_20340 [Candidatus Helarchaeota archaeon]
MPIFTEEDLEKIEKNVLDALRELKRTSRTTAKRIIEEAIEGAIS